MEAKAELFISCSVTAGIKFRMPMQSGNTNFQRPMLLVFWTFTDSTASPKFSKNRFTFYSRPPLPLSTVSTKEPNTKSVWLVEIGFLCIPGWPRIQIYLLKGLHHCWPLWWQILIYPSQWPRGTSLGSFFRKTSQIKRVTHLSKVALLACQNHNRT